MMHYLNIIFDKYQIIADNSTQVNQAALICFSLL